MSAGSGDCCRECVEDEAPDISTDVLGVLFWSRVGEIDVVVLVLLALTSLQAVVDVSGLTD